MGCSVVKSQIYEMAFMNRALKNVSLYPFFLLEGVGFCPLPTSQSGALVGLLGAPLPSIV